MLKGLHLSPQRLKADLLLLIVAAIWGSAFVAQRSVAQSIGVFSFNGYRFLLGGLILLPFVKSRFIQKTSDLIYMLAAGFAIFIAGALQQIGLKTTTAGNAGFLTSLYVVILPILLFLIFKKTSPWNTWLGVAISCVGIYLLNGPGGLVFNSGNFLELLGAFAWAAHMIIISFGVKKIGALSISIGQFLICGLLNLLCGLIFEHTTVEIISNTLPAILYTGVVSVGIGYTLQVFGQKHAPPTDAAIILSLEAVFAAISGYVILNEKMVITQLMGGILIVMAIIVSQIYKTDNSENSI
jgi:drug/metabolite transporter (DMT)-like permease